MTSFFSSIADKAQSALKDSPLAQHLPAGMTGGGGGAEGGIAKSHALEAIHHQLRTFQQQYSSSVSPLQKIVTTMKGIAIDFDSVGRDAQTHSKELYQWSQSEREDIKDVVDRLAWINFIEGSLANGLAKKLDASRGPFKGLRDAEAGVMARRAARAGLGTQIGRLEQEQQRGNEGRIGELRRQLEKAEAEDEAGEKAFALEKRKAIRESEEEHWEAVREYAEKLLLLSQAASSAVAALPVLPPSAQQPYVGAESTAAVRATLQTALDNYKPGDVALPRRTPSATDLRRSDTRSFGETHATELSRMNSADHLQPDIPLTPPPASPAVPPYTGPSPRPNKASPPPLSALTPPLNPAALNNAPAPIPILPIPAAHIPDSPDSPITPTIAETGLPQSAGHAGPGPATGSLRDLKQPPGHKSAQQTKGPYGADFPAKGAQSFPTAQEEKQRLLREERERILAAENPPPEEQFESATDEKKRLDKEERERVLGAGGSGSAPPPPGDDNDLPPSYEEF